MVRYCSKIVPPNKSSIPINAKAKTGLFLCFVYPLPMLQAAMSKIKLIHAQPCPKCAHLGMIGAILNNIGAIAH